MAREVNTIAPWAEIVPNAPYPMTIEEFMRWPEEAGWKYELIDGRLVRMAGPGKAHARMQKYIEQRILDPFVEAHDLGEVFHPYVYNLPLLSRPDNAVIPDVSFIAKGRGSQPGTPEDSLPEKIAPDLAIEIASPSDTRKDLSEKVTEKYLPAGTREVWVFYPKQREVDIWYHGEHGPESFTLKADQRIENRDVLPGFSHPVADFFSAYDRQPDRQQGYTQEQNHSQDFSH